MLVLSRKPAESIVIDHGIRITVLKIRRHCVSLGIQAPDGLRVFRNELLEASRPSPDRPSPFETWELFDDLDGDASETPSEPPDSSPPRAEHPRDDQTLTP